VSLQPEKFKNTMEGRVSNGYLTGDYPSFLKPHKVYAYRRLDDTNTRGAMEVALERYERELLN